MGESGSRMVEAILKGERDAVALAKHFHWAECFVPDSDDQRATYKVVPRSWSGSGTETDIITIDPRTDSVNGKWYINMHPLDVSATRVLRRESESVWGQNPVAQAVLAFAGDLTGDLVEFDSTLRLDQRPSGANPVAVSWNWYAEEVGGLRYNGPSGTGARKWSITTSPGLSWNPASYRVVCEATLDDGVTIVGEMAFEVAWRTQRYLVTGQVVPFVDFNPPPLSWHT
jgi:hypothetical protein